MSPIDVFVDILQQNYKGLIGVGSIDGIFLTGLFVAYVYRGVISYTQWFDQFRWEAYFSIAIVFLLNIVLYYVLRPTKKKSDDRYIS